MLACVATVAQQAMVIGNRVDVLIVVNGGITISEISSTELHDIFTGARDLTMERGPFPFF
jgi:hypothetical protein